MRMLSRCWDASIVLASIFQVTPEDTLVLLRFPAMVSAVPFEEKDVNVRAYEQSTRQLYVVSP